MKSVMQEDQLKYVDAEGMRIITNSKHVAEQIKSDKDKCVAMDDQKITETNRQGIAVECSAQGTRIGAEVFT